MLYPVPPVLVSCSDSRGHVNIITVAWAGTVCSDPVMVSIAIKPERFSHGLIKDSGQFVVNLPSRRMVRAVDFCGVRSGRDTDKFQATGLIGEPAGLVKAPIIAQAPVALECQVESVLELGSHHLFLGKVLGVQVNEELVDRNGRLNLARADLIAYVHGHYWTLKETVGSFGFSVKKRK
jgi:flavin reductase (DIM6/NTAB) family NADH-FMN oxidoreductase RutF